MESKPPRRRWSTRGALPVPCTSSFEHDLLVLLRLIREARQTREARRRAEPRQQQSLGQEA
jgi:hypothetical protein